MAHILVLSLVFPPDGVSTAVIVGEIAADLQASGHQVTVVTTTPHYNRDAQAEARQPMVSTAMPFVSRSEFRGVRVLHMSMPPKGSSVPLRLIAWVRFHALSLVAAALLVRRVDAILAPSPPLTIGVCAWLLGSFYRAPYIYNVQELYPDIAVSLGALRNRWLIRILLGLERFVYGRARIVTVIAARMRLRILGKSVVEHKVRLIPNFVDVDDMTPLPKVNEFSREHGLDTTFVVTYAGNMGPAQGLETVLETASLLRGEPDVRFLLVGEGVLRERLSAVARERGLSNVLILPYQPYGLVPQIYAASDLCLVPLAPDTGSDAIPSKVYRIMACARPVLACADSESDLAELVAVARCGTVVPPHSAADLARAIADAKRDPETYAEMGRAGRDHVVEHYSRGAISAQYEALVREIVRPVPHLARG